MGNTSGHPYSLPDGYVGKKMLEELHVGHPGIVRMKELARSYFWWPNVDLEIEQTVRNCSSCQQVRKTTGVSSISTLVVAE